MYFLSLGVKGLKGWENVSQEKEKTVTHGCTRSQIGEETLSFWTSNSDSVFSD